MRTLTQPHGQKAPNGRSAAREESFPRRNDWPREEVDGNAEPIKYCGIDRVRAAGKQSAFGCFRG